MKPSIRSLLFVPGDRPDRFDKATSSEADAVIIDLEDSVREEAKEDARSQTVSWLSDSRTGAWVRINAAESAAHQDDLAALQGTPSLRGIVLPKAESSSAIDMVARVLGEPVPMIALIETARGLLDARAVAEHPSVRSLAFGNLDFAADCGMVVSQDGEPELLPARTHLVLVSRAAGLAGPVDGVTADIRAADAAERDARRAADLGFSGKLCVHPAQVPAVHRGFAPRPEQVAWARNVVDAVDDGVAVVEGAMVDRPVLVRARAILARTAG